MQQVNSVAPAEWAADTFRKEIFREIHFCNQLYFLSVEFVVFNWLPNKTWFDFRSFYIGETHTNQDSWVCYRTVFEVEISLVFRRWIHRGLRHGFPHGENRLKLQEPIIHVGFVWNRLLCRLMIRFYQSPYCLDLSDYVGMTTCVRTYL